MLIIFKILIIVFFIAYLSISITTMLNPHYTWRIFESWKAVKQPSEKYFLFNRIMGGIATLFGLFLLISFLKRFF